MWHGGSLLKLVCRSLKGLRWPWSYWPWGGPALLTSDRGFDAVSLKGTGRLTGNTPKKVATDQDGKMTVWKAGPWVVLLACYFVQSVVKKAFLLLAFFPGPDVD